MRILGIDLAWGEGTTSRPANETGVVAADSDGTVVAAGWTRGPAATLAWIDEHAAADTLAMVDAPLLVTNPTGQRLCERQTGQRYGRWKVSANSSNLGLGHLAGVSLLRALEERGWAYSTGLDGPPTRGRHLIECYPYAVLVGAEEFGYDRERPAYKRAPRRMRAAEFRPIRAAVCDDLLRRLDTLSTVDPPLHLRTHPVTEALVTEPSPLDDGAYKHREDLLDAAICAWAGLLWCRHGLARCQVLGDDGSPSPATIVVPARPEQRR